MSRKSSPRRPRQPTQASRFGYELLPGKARQYRNNQTGKQISYNAFRKLIGNNSTSSGTKVQRFEAALARTRDLERAKRESGLSNRQLTAYRAQFENDGRTSASPFEKVGRRWVFRGSQGYPHAFINLKGAPTKATFSGHNLIAMQDYRSAVRERSQAELDAWEKMHLSGVADDAGSIHYPETNLSKIDAAQRRMTRREINRFKADQFYLTAIVLVG